MLSGARAQVDGQCVLGGKFWSLDRVLNPMYSTDMANLSPIVRSPGVNASERILVALCDKAFLPLWCYPNVFRTPGKELCDVLVIFGDDIIIFSDKASNFNTVIDSELAWTRWKRKTIEKSAEQLERAEHWLKNHSDRIFLDGKCKEKVPLPIRKGARIHKVLVAQGAAEACQKHFGSATGSLITNGYSIAKPPTEQKFCVYHCEYDSFFHILDEATLPLILNELDTAADFIDYLSQRETALLTDQVSISMGEEGLLAMYLKSCISGQFKRKFIHFDDKPEGASVIVDDRLWYEVVTSEEYQKKQLDDRASYYWDSIMQELSQAIVSGAVANPNALGLAEHEMIARIMASVGRYRRRVLSLSMAERQHSTKVRSVGLRFLMSEGHAYVMCVFSDWEFASWEEYRAHRQFYAIMYARYNLLIHPGLDQVIGIAYDAAHSSSMSYDFVLALRSEPFSPIELKEISLMRKRCKWGRSLEVRTFGFVHTLEMRADVIETFSISKPSTAGAQKSKAEDDTRRRKQKTQKEARKKGRQKGP